MKKHIPKLLLTTFVLVVICYILQKLTHNNRNFWSIIPSYWASSAAYWFQMNTSVSRKVRIIVDMLLIVLAIVLLITFIYILIHS